MHVITAYNVNDAYNSALWLFRSPSFYHEVGTRNGKDRRANTPVATVYKYPWEKVLFCGKRDANPFFHLFEAMWMLAGRDDVAWPAKFAKQIAEYSDHGHVLHGAYGYRWRRHFDVDQLGWAIKHLKENPNSRRCVVQMFDSWVDHPAIDRAGKDIPCNTQIFFSIQDGDLNMMVTNRSNDVVWGCYGANAVHFAFLQEYIAIALGVGIGTYTQVSNDFHIYERHWPLIDTVPTEPTNPYMYQGEGVGALVPVIQDKVQFDHELGHWFNDPLNHDYEEPFIKQVLAPMFVAWHFHKQGETAEGIDTLQKLCMDSAWSKAGIEWLERRIKVETFP